LNPQPSDPTGNTETEPPPLAVSTYPLQTPYPEQDIQFEYRAVEPGHSLAFRAIGFNFWDFPSQPGLYIMYNLFRKGKAGRFLSRRLVLIPVGINCPVMHVCRQ